MLGPIAQLISILIPISDPEVESSISAQSFTFVEIDH